MFRYFSDTFPILFDTFRYFSDTFPILFRYISDTFYFDKKYKPNNDN